MPADPQPIRETPRAPIGAPTGGPARGAAWGPAAPREPHPTTVLLRHDLPDGSWHLDWMLLPDGAAGDRPDDRVLVTFRLNDRPDRLAPGAILSAERLPPHRALYLRFEGDLGGGRGVVARVACGQVLACRVEDGEGLAVVRWDVARLDAAAATYRLRRTDGDRWRIAAVGECRPSERTDRVD